MADVELRVSDFHGGRIAINSHVIGSYPWEGTYFKDIPFQLTAHPGPGYRFVGWTGITSEAAILGEWVVI